MKDLKALLSRVKEEFEQGNIVSIFLKDLASQKVMYGELTHIDYTCYGFTKIDILDAFRELEKQKEIEIVDSGNMGWWILPYNNEKKGT